MTGLKLQVIRLSRVQAQVLTITPISVATTATTSILMFATTIPMTTSSTIGLTNIFKLIGAVVTAISVEFLAKELAGGVEILFFSGGIAVVIAFLSLYLYLSKQK